MTSNDFILQLQGQVDQPAQLNEPFLATMGVSRHLSGGTAHEGQEHASTFAQPFALFLGLPTRVSHTRGVETSPAATPQHTAFVPVEHAAVGAGAAPDDLVLRRLPTRALRDRQRLLHRVLAEAAPTGQDGPRLPEGVGQVADGSLALHRGRHSADAGSAAGGPLVRRGFYRHRLRWLARGMPTHDGVGTTFGPSEQRW